MVSPFVGRGLMIRGSPMAAAKSRQEQILYATDAYSSAMLLCTLVAAGTLIDLAVNRGMPRALPLWLPAVLGVASLAALALLLTTRRRPRETIALLVCGVFLVVA